MHDRYNIINMYIRRERERERKKQQQKRKEKEKKNENLFFSDSTVQEMYLTLFLH